LGSKADETLSWMHLVKSASLTAVLLYGAIYASKQSNLHRNNEKKTRWFALEVKAIKPFISSLTQDQQKALIEKFSEKLFGQNAHQETSDTTEFNPNMLKAVGEMVAQIAKSTKK
jgi:hypothetical protein